MKSQLSYAEIAKQISDVSGRMLTPQAVSNARMKFGVQGNRTHNDLTALWPRDANFMLFHLHEQGMPVVRMAEELSKAFGQECSPKVVGEQIERLRVRPRGPQGGDLSGTGRWQPDALAML